MGRTLAIGDVHGCLAALLALEEWLGFCPDDRLILLGDYVDRGPDSRGVIEWLMDRSQIWPLIALRGNHELMMLAALARPGSLTWRLCGGESALASYAGPEDDLSVDLIPEDHRQFLVETLRPYFETEQHLFAHASLEPDLPLDQQPELTLYWQPLNDCFVPHQSGKTLICGHTSQKNGLPKVVPGCVCIDTWACGNGWLSCLDVETGQYWQTSQQGRRRMNKLVMPPVGV